MGPFLSVWIEDPQGAGIADSGSRESERVAPHFCGLTEFIRFFEDFFEECL